ncbi:hypothetical protein BCU68_04320 [Vibrio sp. 10N.286.49.B3]|uniref:hypothetical protein n=1 Tax=Vibrio sp. 10N.286.49.B3 TaxID=1880855 RepID=UPI000C84B768|nr:hypothetical protein [Vibrio sp. 10N.286.49.B3]PMH43219.1 hypothetical protein BCU68_04320 [Vibrio sp. 10N.286.49.B3]
MTLKPLNQDVEGTFVDLNGERYYKISNVDQMNPFFISVVSASDHWLFISSTGSLSAGRIRPENALFPYKSVDHIHESADNTGSKTIIRVHKELGSALWEPFNHHHDGLYSIQRNIYKNTIGDKLMFEELNHSLQLKFEYSWNTSEEFGFIRHAQVTNLSADAVDFDLIDGIQNILPSGAPLSALQTRSALVDAYKWNEQVADSSLALYTMYAKLSDRAEPAESLLATTVFSLESDKNHDILLSSQQLSAFRKGHTTCRESVTKGVRGSYFIKKSLTLAAHSSQDWTIIADIDKDHNAISKLKDVLADCNDLSSGNLKTLVQQSIDNNQQDLMSLMSGADAWQLTAEESTSVHHYANVLFNNMRGGVVENNYQLDKNDVLKTLLNTNKVIFKEYAELFADLPETFTHSQLIEVVALTNNKQLIRLCYEYLPLTFGRRHGDPSRPWNHYEIKLKGDNGDRLLSYQGNWRDIFQNWEAIALSYPEFIPSFLAKFVNASTMDGYNPYRITKEGIDWELLEADDPWSNIGYWGDHQIIYLLKFLELADKYQHNDLMALLEKDIFSYANVPYKLCSVDKLFENPKDTVTFNHQLQAVIEGKVAKIGSDGRLVLDANDQVYMVNLMEKILVPLLAKLSNFVIDGGIWLNTQRPEWNDANNAIVGNGLSMVTLYYIRRYLAFLTQLIKNAPSTFILSNEVSEWMLSVSDILIRCSQDLAHQTMTGQARKTTLSSLEVAAEKYRRTIYQNNGFSGKIEIQTNEIEKLLSASLAIIDVSIERNYREDGLFNAYNILSYTDNSVTVEALYPMLEGQVAVLSSGYLTPSQAVNLLDKLFSSEMYRDDQKSFMLYPERKLKHFIDKNSIPAPLFQQHDILQKMLAENDTRIINQDSHNHYHFNAQFENNGYLMAAIEQVKIDYPQVDHEQWQQIADLYEQTFDHKSFTGRSGTMFGYEGLGCIYWHMVSKLLLAVQENYQMAWQQDANSNETKQLANYYYRVREGIGFNKTPLEYGAFPTDPYSHTPKHAGAQQPGMTGQVKEEVITRFGELGLEVEMGAINIKPTLLHRAEFLTTSSQFKYQDIQNKVCSLTIAQNELAFTYCQVPFVYQLCEDAPAQIQLHMKKGNIITFDELTIPAQQAHYLYSRTGLIEKVTVSLTSMNLLQVKH